MGEISREEALELAIHMYAYGKSVESLNDVRRRTAKSEFERYWEKEIEE